MCPRSIALSQAFEPGASGLPYYYTPPVCVPAVIGALAMWPRRQKKGKKETVSMCVRMPLSLRSIAGVPSSQALPGFPITAHHLCAFLLELEG